MEAFVKKITNNPDKMNEFTLQELKPISKEVKKAYKIDHIEFDQNLVDQRFDQRRHNFVKQFYFTRSSGADKREVILLTVEDEFPTIKLFQPVIKS